MEQINNGNEPLSAKTYFSKIGFAYFGLLVATMVLQFALSAAVSANFPGWTKSPWYVWCISTLPMYLSAGTILILLLRRIPIESWEGSRLGLGKWFTYFIVSVSVMYLGSFIGNALSGLVGLITGKSMVNPVALLLLSANPWLSILFAVILAPLVEEYIFRKLLIDRLRKYGDKLAILLSALIFGLAHGNLFQFFYAFGLGAIFAYIYCKTRRIRYSAFLHMTINAIGGVIAPLLVKGMDMNSLAKMQTGAPQALGNMLDRLPQLILLGLFGTLMICLTIAGIVLIIQGRKRINFAPGSQQLPKEHHGRIVFGNFGMLCFFAASVCMFVFVLVK